jgi:hypothetical protein
MLVRGVLGMLGVFMRLQRGIVNHGDLVDCKVEGLIVPARIKA